MWQGQAIGYPGTRRTSECDLKLTVASQGGAREFLSVRSLANHWGVQGEAVASNVARWRADNAALWEWDRLYGLSLALSLLSLIHI